MQHISTGQYLYSNHIYAPARCLLTSIPPLRYAYSGQSELQKPQGHDFILTYFQSHKARVPHCQTALSLRTSRSPFTLIQLSVQRELHSSIRQVYMPSYLHRVSKIPELHVSALLHLRQSQSICLRIATLTFKPRAYISALLHLRQAQSFMSPHCQTHVEPRASCLRIATLMSSLQALTHPQILCNQTFVPLLIHLVARAACLQSFNAPTLYLYAITLTLL